MNTTPAKPVTEKLVEYVPFGGQDKIKLTCDLVRKLIANPTRSGALPDDRDCIKFMALCQAKRLNPFEGDAFLIGYDGKRGPEFSLITAHQTYLKRAEINPEYDGMRSGVIVENAEGDTQDIEGDFFSGDVKLVGGWATVYFKTRKYPMNKRLRLERFQKQFGVWQDDPAGMIVKCAEADALRSAFPTMLGGLYMREEVSFLGNGSAIHPETPAASKATVTILHPAQGVEAEPLTVEPIEEKSQQQKIDLTPTVGEEVRSAQQLLADFAGSYNCSFDDFVKKMTDAGYAPKMPSIQAADGFDQISFADAKKILAAKRGIGAILGVAA